MTILQKTGYILAQATNMPNPTTTTSNMPTYWIAIILFIVVLIFFLRYAKATLLNKKD